LVEELRSLNVNKKEDVKNGRNNWYFRTSNWLYLTVTRGGSH
jgi:hypothetical protein